MKDFDIFVDSGANIPSAYVKEKDIHVVSFMITVNGEERLCYQEGVDSDEISKRFYEDMRAGVDVKTSLIGAQTFIEAFTPTLEAGRDIIAFTISSGISGTYNQACEAKKELETRYPNNTVYVIDSANASMGTGLLALKVADLRDMGESVQACAEWAKENTYKCNSYLTVGDLKYLKKSGRISTTLAIAGTLLNIKPILRADGGVNAKIVSHGKERGRKKALSALANTFAELVTDPAQRIAIMHADCEEDALELKALVEARGAKDIVMGYYDPCTGSHAGPGTVALFFMGKDRRAASPFCEKSGALAAQPVEAK